MTSFRARIDKQGRLVIPAELLAAAGIEPGSGVALEARDGEAYVRSVDTAVARVQKKYERLARDRNMVDELLTERRLDAADSGSADRS